VKFGAGHVQRRRVGDITRVLGRRRNDCDVKIAGDEQTESAAPSGAGTQTGTAGLSVSVAMRMPHEDVVGLDAEDGDRPHAGEHGPSVGAKRRSVNAADRIEGSAQLTSIPSCGKEYVAARFYH